MPYSRANLSGSNNVLLTEQSRMRAPLPGMIADMVFPELFREGVENFMFRIWDDSNCYYQAGQSARPNGKPSNRVHSQIPGYKTGTTSPHSLHDVITDTDMRREAANGGNPEALKRIMTNKLTDKLSIEKEIVAATLATTSTYYTTDTMYTTLSTGETFDADTSDPIGVVTTGLKKFRNLKPNKIIVDGATYLDLRKNAQLLDRNKVAKGELATKAQLEAIFEMELLIGDLQYFDLANKTWKYAWGDNMILAYINPNISGEVEDMTYGRMVYSRRRLVKEIEQQDADIVSATKIEVQEDYVPVLVGVDNATNGYTQSAYLIANTRA